MVMETWVGRPAGHGKESPGWRWKSGTAFGSLPRLALGTHARLGWHHTNRPPFLLLVYPLPLSHSVT